MLPNESKDGRDLDQFEKLKHENRRWIKQNLKIMKNDMQRKTEIREKMVTLSERDFIDLSASWIAAGESYVVLSRPNNLRAAETNPANATHKELIMYSSQDLKDKVINYIRDIQKGYEDWSQKVRENRKEIHENCEIVNKIRNTKDENKRHDLCFQMNVELNYLYEIGVVR